MRTRIFLSWCHQDRVLKEALLRDLLPALGVFTDLDVEWWQDSHLSCGEELTAGIVARLDEADFGLLLLSTRYFGRPFIREHELPRFAGPRADKGSLPVALSPLPAFGPEHNLGGIERQVVFTRDTKSFAELFGSQRTRFANELAAAIRRRRSGGAPCPWTGTARYERPTARCGDRPPSRRFAAALDAHRVAVGPAERHPGHAG